MFVKEYTDKIDYGKSPLEYLKENRGFIKEKDGEIQISTAAILLFGKNPQNFFPRARIRFIRYEGTEEKFGTEMECVPRYKIDEDKEDEKEEEPKAEEVSEND